ncbi:MAG TPA: hypothetical protein VFM05_05315, partial [Candidatus Saccharimonadales bacterium]|nr:hypothetical protein [Candidatus Saccharimonadales bacterium]
VAVGITVVGGCFAAGRLMGVAVSAGAQAVSKTVRRIRLVLPKERRDDVSVGERLGRDRIFIISL